MKIKGEVVGARGLAAKLRRMEAAVAGKALEAAVLSGALLIRNEASTTAPFISGNLRRSLHVGGHVSESGDLVDTTGTDIGGNTNSHRHAEVHVGTNVVYARRLEYGFVGSDAKGRTFNQAAKPYLRPALDNKREEARDEIVAALREILRKQR